MGDTPFEYDVFISFAHRDNATLSKEQEGWIAMLHRALELRLGELLGETPKIWRDPKLQGNDDFNQEIVSNLLSAAVLVSVLSPSFVKSDWCRKELQEFIRAAEKNSGVFIRNKSRVFKVIKTPIPLEQHPAEIKGLLGYEFFREDPHTHRPHEFVNGFGREVEPEYWTRMGDLAYDIRQLLEMIKAENTASGPLAPRSGMTVYLAETTSDLSTERDQIRRDLQSHGHTVLPDQHLPLTGPELEKEVRAMLQGCRLSIHLIGERYGIIPEAAAHSVTELQNTLATTYSQQNAHFSRLVWLPPGLHATDERQQALLTALRNDPALQVGDDLLQTSLEELKTVIHDRLQRAETPRDASTPAKSSGPTRIYLLYDQPDQEAVQPLDDYLFDHKCEILRPLFQGDEGAVSEEHQANLRDCDAILLYYGQAEEAWLRGKLRDVRKAPGYGRTSPLLSSAIYMAGPHTPQKERYRTHEVAMVLKNFEQFTPDSLEPFLSAVARKNGGQS
jgi:hypothetical protein